jgi:hypothetical protein
MDVLSLLLANWWLSQATLIKAMTSPSTFYGQHAQPGQLTDRRTHAHLPGPSSVAWQTGCVHMGAIALEDSQRMSACRRELFGSQGRLREQGIWPEGGHSAEVEKAPGRWGR